MELDYEPTKQEEDHSNQERLLSRFTIEHAIYLLIIIAAGVLRLMDITFVPLSPSEATEAISIWNFWQPDSAPVTFASPAYFSSTVFLTQILGFNDAVMRLVPALFGIGLVILPGFLRHRTGKMGAILASLLLALSPSLTAISRTAGGQSVAIFAGLLILIAWLRYQESREKYWFYVLVVAIALGLTSAPIYYGILVALTLAWIAQALVGPALMIDEEGQRLPTHWPGRQTVRDGSLIGLGVLIMVATAFVILPGGVGATTDLLASWLGQFFGQVGARAWLSPFLAVGRYEIVLVILGIPAIIWATRKEFAFPIYLVYWICGSLLIMLLQPGEMGNLLIITLPGYLLVGCFGGQLLARMSEWYDVGVAFIVFIAGGIILVNVARFGRLTAFQSSKIGAYHALLAITAFVLATIAITLIWSWRERSVAGGVVGGLILLLLILMWSDAWWLSRDGGNDTRERLTAAATDNDIYMLAKSVREISWQVTNSERDLSIKSTVDYPSLRWYLRDMVDLEIVSTLPSTDFSQALITPMSDIPPLNNEYIGSDFSILRTGTPHLLDFSQSLTWRLFRESPVPINEEQLIFWLRADLAGGSL